MKGEGQPKTKIRWLKFSIHLDYLLSMLYRPGSVSNCPQGSSPLSILKQAMFELTRNY